MLKSQQFVTLASLSLILANNVTGTQYKKEIPETSTFSLHLKCSYSFLSSIIFYFKEEIKSFYFFIYIFIFFSFLFIITLFFFYFQNINQMDQSFSIKSIGYLF